MRPQHEENIIEHEENIIKIVRQTLSEQPLQGKIAFDPIRIIPDDDYDIGEILRVIIVVDSDSDNPWLGPGLTPKLIRRVKDYLETAGMNHFPVPYYVGKWEWPQYERSLPRAI